MAGITSYESAFDILDIEPQEKALLKEKSRLMNRINDKIKFTRCTQAKAAEILKVTQPRICRLLGGNISEFSLDCLFMFNYLIDNHQEK